MLLKIFTKINIRDERKWNSDLITGEITTHCFKKYSFPANHEQIRILLAFNKQQLYKRECFNKDAVDILIKAKLLNM